MADFCVDEVLLRTLAERIYFRVVYSDTGVDWKDLNDSDQQFYCAAAEDVLNALKQETSK